MMKGVSLPEGVNPKDLVGAKKAPLDLVPPALIIGAAEAIGNGAEKYGPYNWRDYPIQTMTYIGAMLRHLTAYMDGEECAEDSGVHHLKHVAAGCAILLDAIASGQIVDNRPPKGPAAELLAEQDKSVAPSPLTKDQADRKCKVEFLEHLDMCAECIEAGGCLGVGTDAD